MAAAPPMPPATRPAAAAGPPLPATTEPLRIPSERLFAGAQEVLIEHASGLYRLKKTALGKLILTK